MSSPGAWPLPPGGIGLSKPEIIVFYAYKGGTGRTLCLVNLALSLVGAGARVLVLDGDLEAPGVCEFRPFRDARLACGDRPEQQPGLLEVLHVYRKAYVDGTALNGTELIARSAIQVSVAGVVEAQGPYPLGELKYLPATCSCDYDRVMLERLAQLDLAGTFREGFGEQMFARFRADLQSLPFDVVLIDSRTGLSEVSGAIVNDLATTLVLVTAPNRQGFRGLSAAVRALQGVRQASARPLPRLHLLLTRIPWDTDVALSPWRPAGSPEEIASQVFDIIQANDRMVNIGALKTSLTALVRQLDELQPSVGVHVFPHDRTLSLDEPVFAGLQTDEWPVAAQKRFLRLVGALQEDLAARAARELGELIMSEPTGDHTAARFDMLARWLARPEQASWLASQTFDEGRRLLAEQQVPSPTREAIEQEIDGVLSTRQGRPPALATMMVYLRFGDAALAELVVQMLLADVALRVAAPPSVLPPEFTEWVLVDLAEDTRPEETLLPLLHEPLVSRLQDLRTRFARVASSPSVQHGAQFAAREAEWAEELPTGLRLLGGRGDGAT